MLNLEIPCEVYYSRKVQGKTSDKLRVPDFFFPLLCPLLGTGESQSQPATCSMVGYLVGYFSTTICQDKETLEYLT